MSGNKKLVYAAFIILNIAFDSRALTVQSGWKVGGNEGVARWRKNFVVTEFGASLLSFTSLGDWGYF